MTGGLGVHAWGLAVDFGTTATAAATVTGDRVSLLSLDGGDRMSSAVYATESEGAFLVGKEADNEAATSLDRYESTPKRKIHRPSVGLGGQQYAPVELVAVIMTHVLREALGQHNGSPPSQLALTHPVGWTSSRRQILADAVQAAARKLNVSLPDPVFVPEPVAAAQWYSLGQHHDPPQVGQKFAVYDLGGGTFDVAILERTVDDYTEINKGALDPLGGDDFDHKLFTYLGGKYIAKEDEQLWSDLQRPAAGDVDMAERRRQMWTKVQFLKEKLSDQTSRSTRLRGVVDPILVTREEFETLIVADVERTIDELLATLDERGLAPNDLAVIYRVGGASRVPLVGRKLEALGAPVYSDDDPKLVVAKGAALILGANSEAPSRPPPPPPPPPAPRPPAPVLEPDPKPEPPPAREPEPIPDPEPTPQAEPAPPIHAAMGRWAWRSVKTGTALIAASTAISAMGWLVFRVPVAILVAICLVGGVIGALMVRIGSLSSDKAGRGWLLSGIVLVAAVVAWLGHRLLMVEFSVDVDRSLFTLALGSVSAIGVLLIVAPQWSHVPGRGAVTALTMGGVVIVAVDVIAILAANESCRCNAQSPSDFATIAAGIALVAGGIAARRRRRRLATSRQR